MGSTEPTTEVWQLVSECLSLADPFAMQTYLAGLPNHLAAEVRYHVARYFARERGRELGLRAVDEAPPLLRSLVLRLMWQG